MIKVLIAEDNPVNLELLCEILGPLGCEIIAASNGQIAIARLDEMVPDVVLLDINMPVMDGFAVIGEIKKRPTLENIPVIAITAYAMKNDRARVLGAGFDSYISKPIDAPRLLEEIQRLIPDSRRKALLD